MEVKGYLNPKSESDLYCLHLIFIPLIQSSLDEFSGGWNRHGLTTLPQRLFTNGLTKLPRLAEEGNYNFTE